MNIGVYTAYAYNDDGDMGCVWENPTSVEYKYTSDTSSDWRNIHAESVVKWNNATSKINMSYDYNLSTPNTFGVFQENSNTLGRAFVYCKNFGTSDYISSADAGLNETSLGQPGTSGTYDDSDRITVAMHEHGHFLGLGHSDYYAVMRDPYVDAISAPTSDDLAGINSLYP